MPKKHCSEETRRKQSERAKARFQNPENHPNWKGGKRINHNGYVEILQPDHPRARGNGYVFEHILVAEKKLGRPINLNEDVHHINRIKTDNSPENITVLLKSEHPKEHKQKPTGIYKTCPICGRSFYVKPSHMEKRTTCSIKCAGVLFSKYYTEKPRDYRPTKEEKEEILCSIK